jgi:hypothetical protein
MRAKPRDGQLSFLAMKVGVSADFFLQSTRGLFVRTAQELLWDFTVMLNNRVTEDWDSGGTGQNANCGRPMI